MKSFVVYKSSAGSGKTYTLVREYLALALQAPGYFRHVLAITFTNKAANEMKQRVLSSLLHISDPSTYKDSSAVRYMMPELSAKSGLAMAEISSKAGLLLKSILHDYDDFAVRTIDSFVTRIIRTFAHDLHLPVDFEIEMDEDVLLDEAVHNLVGRAGIDHEITKIIVEFSESKTDDEKSWQIEEDLKTAGSHLFSEEGYMQTNRLKEITPSAILSMIRKIRKFREDFEESVKVPAGKAMLLISQNGIPINSFFQGKNGIGAYFGKLSKGLVGLPNSYVNTTTSEDTWYASKLPGDIKSAIDSIKHQLLAYYYECEDALKDYRYYCLFGLIYRYIYQLGVMSEIEKELDSIRKDRRVLHISEFNKRITDLILKEPVPFIYERTGEKYSNYLIDEFQDTSELQWKNLLPLVSNSLASGNFNLVVGDGKQAIYRFRNGKVEQFMLLPGLPHAYDRSVFGDAEKALRNNYQEELLSVNYRSLPAIIEFNNDFFSFISAELDDSLLPIYRDHQQKPLAGKEGGLVSLDFLEYKSAGEFDKANLQRIHAIVQELFDSGYMRKDLVVLTRTNIQAGKVARFLMGKGIEVVSAEALLLATSQEVNFLVSVLSILRDPSDVIASASVLIYLKNSGRIELDTETLRTIVKEERVLRYLNDRGYLFDRDQLLSFPIYDLCEEIIRIFGTDQEKYNPYLQFFLEFVNTCSQKGIYLLSGLLEAWEEKKNKLSVVVPEGINAVRIMTIHKAKGLEFPVVIWPFATEALKSTRDHTWIETGHPLLEGLPVALLPTSKQLEDAGLEELYREERNKSLLDMINLIYVAFTRPIERFYLITRDVGDSKSTSTSLHAYLRLYLDKTALNWTETNPGSYRFGESVMRKEELAEGEQVPRMEKFISVPWQQKVLIARRGPQSWDPGNAAGFQEWGNLVHEALSHVRSREDLGPVIEAMCVAGYLDETSSAKLERQLLAVLDHPEVGRYFTPETVIKSEAGILMPDGMVIRPDRVILSGDEVIILEYKTGLPREDHAMQVIKYASALLEMGYTRIRKLLVYVDDVVEVTELT